MENLGIGSPGSDPNKKSNQNVIDPIGDFIKQAPIFNLQKTMAQDRGPTGQGNRTGDVGTIQAAIESNNNSHIIGPDSNNRISVYAIEVLTALEHERK